MAIVPDDVPEDERRDGDGEATSPRMVTIDLTTGEAFIETEDGQRVVLWVD
jgi:hypothetical protein